MPKAQNSSRNPTSRKRKVAEAPSFDPSETTRSARLRRRIASAETIPTDSRSLTCSSSASRKTTKGGAGRLHSKASSRDPLDGESLSGSGRRPGAPRSPAEPYRFSHSPGVGGFGGTPLFLNSRSSFGAVHHARPLVQSECSQTLLPGSSDMLQLMLSVSSHRPSGAGVVSSWMRGFNIGNISGRIRLLTCLGYLLLDGNSQMAGSNPCPLTWTDVEYLQSARKELSGSDSDTAELVYLITLVLEDVVQKDLSLKFRLENVLDFNDQITLRGWTDGGRASIGTHSEELREWFAHCCKVVGVPLQDPHGHTSQDISPTHNCKAQWGTERSPLSSSSDVSESPDPFRFDIVEEVLGDFDSFTREVEDHSAPCTPKGRDSVGIDEESSLREILVVDVQTDHALRRHINKAAELRKQFPVERDFVQELRKFIQRRIHFETPETKSSILKLAKSREGFVNIGDVRSGAQSRHLAILFKTLCDATGVYCRLVRDPNDVYYNVIMISDNSAAEESANENRREGNYSCNVSRNASDDEEDGDAEDAPEELIPVFWEPTSVGPQKRIRLTHPLDALLQKCNSAADPVDLDDFFVFDRLLGKGSFGEVWKVELKEKPTRKKAPIAELQSVLIPGGLGSGPFALKIIPPQEADKEEASFMRIYRHPRVVNVIAVFRGFQVLENRKRELEKKPAMCILMEMADKCLETVLTGPATLSAESSPKPVQPAPFRHLDLRFVFRILIDSARAIAYLHSPVGSRPHLVHRDLKPGNVLISADSRAIVTDFGVARMNPSLETNLTVGAGTEGYMAPEQKTLLYDRPADVYSFGVIIARILGVDRWKHAMNLTSEDFGDPSHDPVLAQLCLKCVQASPLHRPSFEQIHQALLCEFIKRELSRNIIRGNIPESQPLAARKSKTTRSKNDMDSVSAKARQRARAPANVAVSVASGAQNNKRGRR